MCGLAAVDGLQGEGMAQDEGQTFAGSEVREPGPRFHADDEGRLRGSDDLEKRCGSRLHIPVKQDLPGLIQDAEGLWGGRTGRCPRNTRATGGGLFELRVKGQEGIARVFYGTAIGQPIVMLHIFIKKSQKTPRKALEIARRRWQEVVSHDPP